MNIPLFKGFVYKIAVYIFRIHCAYAQSTLSRLISFAWIKFGFSHDAIFLGNERVWENPTSLTDWRIRRHFHYIWTSHPSLWYMNWGGAMKFVTDILDRLSALCWKCSKSIYMKHLGCWNHSEKLAEMFLITFHRKRYSKNDAVKSYCEK